MPQLPTPPPACLAIGFRAAEAPLIDKLTGRLALEFGSIFDRSDRWREEAPAPEGGTHRQWLALGDPVDPAELVRLKLHALRLERLYLNPRGRRTVLLEVACVDPLRVTRAVAADAVQRVYLGQGLYGEVALEWRVGEGFAPLPWTEPELADPRAREFLSRVRDGWVAHLAREGARPHA